MDITPLIPSDRQVIQSYNATGFKISGRFYANPVIVFPDRVIDWSVADRTNLTPEDFQIFIQEKNVDVWLLGCGAKTVLLSPSLKTWLKTQGIIIEAMDTGAACRTYNVLLADGRRIAAALLPL